tara:strand:+ start:155 stop:616 length:462 start_codon:yes stop_codon:yes gene_type:complete
MTKKAALFKIAPEAHRAIATVSRVTGIPISNIRGKHRQRDIVNARRISMVLVNDLNKGYSTITIGAIFKRDHATVLHAFKVHTDLYDVDRSYQTLFDACRVAAGIEKMGDSKNKDDIIFMLTARVETLEYENQELIEQLNNIKEATDGEKILE